MTPSGGNQEPRLEISGLLLRVGLFVLIALISSRGSWFPPEGVMSDQYSGLVGQRLPKLT
jgi:hypothetical protein